MFIFGALALGVWAYFSLKNNKKPKVDALSLLPDSCLVYLNTNNFPELNKKLNSQNLIVDKLKLFGEVHKFCDAIELFDSLFSANALLFDEIKNNRIHFAVYGEKLNWLAAFNVSQLGIQDRVKNNVVAMLSAKPSRDEMYSFNLRRGPEFYFSLHSGVVLISDSPVLIAETQDLKHPRLAENNAFKEFRSTTQDNGLLSVYIDHKKYVENRLSSKLNLSAICEDGFSAGAIDLQPSEVKVNGFLEPGANDVISALSSEEAQTTEFINLLPLTTTYFKAFGFSSYRQLRERSDSLWKSGSPDAFWKNVNDSALYNVQAEFFENVSGNLLEFETNSGQRFVMAHVSDTLKALAHLKLMSDSVLPSEDLLLRLNVPQGNDGVTLFLPVVSEAVRYALVYRSCLFFAKRAEDILQLRTYLKNEMLLVKDKSFARYRDQNIPEGFNFLVYSSPNQNHESIRSFFNFETKSKKDPFANFRHFSFSLRNDGGKFRFRWHLINETTSDTEGRNSLWTVKLDTIASQTASRFVNHLSGENELLIQDEARQLYLINAKGNILWKKNTGEKINSPLFTVDVFKNNKYQILFSTKNYLHLLDRKGNYVEGYPVKLPAEASAALSVFDYDNTRDYRLIIACKNNVIYNYSVSGKKQEGFVPVKTDNEVALPVQYVKVGQSDYLVALDKEGKIYTFSRKGDGRIGLKNKAVANCNAFYVDATGNINSTHFVYVDDKNGLINKISFSDKKSIVKLNFDIENAEEVFERVDDNEMMDVIFTRLSEVMAYDLNGNLLLKKDIPNDLSETRVYRNQNHFVILSYSKFRKELAIADQIRQKNDVIPSTALPLVSDLFNDGKKYLIITDRGTLSCAILN